MVVPLFLSSFCTAAFSADVGEKAAADPGKWMGEIKRARMTFEMNISSKRQKPENSVDASHNSAVMIECELERKDKDFYTNPRDLIPYRSKACRVAYSLSDKKEEKLSSGGSVFEITTTTKGSGEGEAGDPSADFIELDIYPSLNMYRFNASSYFGPVETAVTDPGGTSIAKEKIQLSFNPTYRLDASSEGIGGSDGWSMEQYKVAVNPDLVAAKKAALQEAMPKDISDSLSVNRAMNDVSLRYPAVPLIENSPVAVALDPASSSQGTVRAEWSFGGVVLPPPRPVTSAERKDEAVKTGESLAKAMEAAPIDTSKEMMLSGLSSREGSGTISSQANGVAAFADRIVELGKSGAYAAVYDEMAQETKASMSLETWLSMCNMQKQVLGDLNQYRQAAQSPNPFSPKAVDVEYQAQFLKAEGSVTVTIVEEAGKLKVKSFTANSPAFMEQAQKFMAQLSKA